MRDVGIWQCPRAPAAPSPRTGKAEAMPGSFSERDRADARRQFAVSIKFDTEAAPSDLEIAALAPLVQELRERIEEAEPILPGADYRVRINGTTINPPNGPFPLPALLLAYLEDASPKTFEDFEQLVKKINDASSDVRGDLLPGLPLRPTETWCPSEAAFPHLATTDLALGQLGANAAGCADAKGEKVFVVIVDQGINIDVLLKRVPGAKFAGGWDVVVPHAGEATGAPSGLAGQWPDGHGTRMAEAVLAVAPEATILDLPLLPPRIRALRGFLPWAAWVYASLGWVIPAIQRRPEYRDWRWVICNAWSVYDLTHDFEPDSPWNYGSNPASVVNRLVAEIARTGLADIVFAAGNAGQFCPDRRAPLTQVGPGRSIHGVAALPDVLTVGAVRNDQVWLGYSAQGPSPCDFHSSKPDLVAPSQFTAPDDAARGYSGTSAACALAAGAMAAARSLPRNNKVSPAEMIARARYTAQPLVGRQPDETRIGQGILSIPGLLGP